MSSDPTKTGVKYIGNDTPFVDNLYGSGLKFMPNQTRLVEHDLAAKLIRHAEFVKDVGFDYVTATTNLLTGGGIEIGIAGDSAIALTASVASIGDGYDEVAINDALLKNQTVRLVRNAVISTPIILNSGNTLDIADGVTVKLADGVINGPMITNAAAKLIRQSTVSIVAGSKTIVDSSILPSDAGMSIIIAGAGHGGTQGIPTLLCARILSASVGTAVIDTAAATTVSGATSKYYNRDHDITVRGGHLDFNDGNNPGVANSDGYYNSSHVTKWRRIDRLNLCNMSVKTNSGKYGFCLADVTDYKVINPTFDTFSDGCHISGPAYRGVISGLRGKTGDDYIGVTARDYKYYADTQGDVIGLNLLDIAPDNTSAGRLLLAGGPGHMVDDVRVDGVRGTGRGVFLGSGLDDPNCDPMFNSNIGSVFISDFDMNILPGYSEVHVKAEDVGNVEIVRLGLNNRANGHQYVTIEKKLNTLIFRESNKLKTNETTNQFVINLTNTAAVENVIINSCSFNSAATKYINSVLNVAGTLTRVLISDVIVANATYSSPFNGLLALATGGALGEVVISGIQASAIKVLVQIGQGSVIGSISASNVLMKTCSRLMESSSNVSIMLNGVTIITPYSEAINMLNGANLTVKGAGCYFDPSKDGVSRAASEVVRVTNMDFPVDSAKVTANAGDRHYNTNVASGALKVGPCIYSGAAWKSLLNIA